MAAIPKVLNVAEKNDAAKMLANVMSGGRFQRREGFSKFNKIYEFDYNILGKNCRMVMTSVSGHLFSLDFIQMYRNWGNYPPSKLFEAQLEKYVADNFIPIKRTLEREIKGASDLILWTDGDREGENIAAEIVDVCHNARKRFQIHRARFSEITRQSIIRACNTLGRLDQGMIDAVDARQEIDLRIGCAFSRFQTMRLKKVFPNVLADQLISYGPCQFPTLGFVVDRYKQIQAFVPETFYKIKVTHEVDDIRVEFHWKRGRLFNHTCCLVLYHLCVQSPTATVVNINSKPKSRWRPLPLDTVELEKLASRKLRINAKEAMRIAEHLYTQGFISYPRTETNIFPPSFDLPAMINEQTRDPHWGRFASQILTVGPNPRQGRKTDNAHPPIHPTRYTSGLSGNEQRIYDLVVRHFLACCSNDAKGQETTVEIDIAGERFNASGLIITERNYLEVYPFDKWSDKSIPYYQLNSIFQPSSLEMVDGSTVPPPLLHEADLIGLMEKHGIGTDATHAEHIETIKSRRYVGVQDDGSFVPGELGIGLVEGYDSMGFELSKPKLRAEMESSLNRICNGHCSKEAVVRETIAKYKSVFEMASQQAVKLDQALSKYFGTPSQVPISSNEESRLSEIVRKCPMCRNADMVVKKKRDGFFMLSCLGYPKCYAVQFFPNSVVGAEPHSSFCLKCEPRPVHLLKFQFSPGAAPPFVGNEYVGCSSCDDVLTNMIGIRPIRLSTNNQPPSSNSRGRGPPGPPPAPPPRHSPHRPPPFRGDTFTSPPMGNAHPPSSMRGLGSPGFVGHGDGGVVCGCGEEAILLTVRNEQSNNKGRQFYKCRKRDGENKCDFFLWADQATSPSPIGRGSAHGPPGRGGPSNRFNQTTPSSYSNCGTQGRGGPGFLRGNGRGGARGGARSRAASSTCNCGLTVVERTAQTGNNRGKPFRTCPKPRQEQCGYFEWIDKPTGTKRSSSMVHGGDAHAPVPKKRAPPTCSICHIPGHTKRSCPQS